MGSINIADILYSFSLIILWAADLMYAHKFSLEETKWQANPVCFVVFSLVLLYNLFSPLLLSFSSLTRLMIVVHPFHTDFKETKYGMKILVSMTLVTLIITGCLTFASWVVYGYVPISLCSPFLDPTDVMVTTKIFTWLVFCVQVAAIIFVAIIYIILATEVKKSQQQLQGSTSQQRPNTTIFVQIIVVTASNILCWIPSGVIYLISMFMERYPTEMLVWTTVAVVPINSIVNPTTFIITTLKKLCC